MSRIGLLMTILVLLVLSGCNLANEPEPTAQPAQPTPEAKQTCDQLVSNALSKANTICAATARNQACYGNVLVDAELQPNAATTFTKAGDIADLFSIRKITTTPINLDTQTWGVVILKAQANLPDTLPGQNVTFLLYGDASLDNISPQMRAVVLKTGVTANATTCADAPDSALVLQSPQGSQATMSINGASVTLGSTVYVTAEQNTEMEIGTIEGSAVVSAFNTTRIVQPGAKIGMSLGGGDGLTVTGPPSEPEPFDTQVVAHAPLNLLERPVQVPPAIAPATLTPVPVSTTIPVCAPRTDWAFTYVVRAGDTLSRIAQAAGTTLADLQQGNCITDANQIQAGQILRVPNTIATQAPPTQVPPTATATTAVTPTPTDPNLRADSTSVEQGQCTTIRWDVANISQVYFEGQPTIGSSSQQVCPKSDTTYTLLVVYPDGKRVPYAIRILVVLPEQTQQVGAAG